MLSSSLLFPSSPSYRNDYLRDTSLNITVLIINGFSHVFFLLSLPRTLLGDSRYDKRTEENQRMFFFSYDPGVLEEGEVTRVGVNRVCGVTKLMGRKRDGTYKGKFHCYEEVHSRTSPVNRILHLSLGLSI